MQHRNQEVRIAASQSRDPIQISPAVPTTSFPFLVQDPIQDPWLHLVAAFLCSPSIWTSSLVMSPQPLPHHCLQGKGQEGGKEA